MKNFMNTGMTAILAGFLLLFPVTEAAAAEKVSGQSAPAPASATIHPSNGAAINTEHISAASVLQEEILSLTPSQLAEEENLMAILWVQRSAEFRGLCYQAYNMATMAVDKALAQREAITSLRPLAVVLDLDDTIVSHGPLEMYYVEHPEAKANYKAWEYWIGQLSKKNLLPGAGDFLRYARRHGVEVFYVTGRGPQDREATVRFLQKAGLPLPDERHLLMNDRSGSKMNHFNKLERRYNIICYIGDNAADFPIGAMREENEIIKKIPDTELQNTATKNVKTKQEMPLDVSAMLKHDKNKKRNAIVNANKKDFGTKFILLPNPMYGDWEYNLAKKYRSLPAEQRIALRKAAVKSFEEKNMR